MTDKNNIETLPKVRTLAAAVDEIKMMDPDSAITIGALRIAVADGKIPRITVGNKKLVNMYDVYTFLKGECVIDEEDTPPGFKSNGIRRIG